MLLTILSNRYFIIIAVLIFISSLVFYTKYLYFKNLELSSKLNECQIELDERSKELNNVTRELNLQIELYRKKVSSLLKKANKPVRVIEIPKVVVKKIYIPTDDCKKMAIMIDNFIKINKEVCHGNKTCEGNSM